jgi:hypothetical protein
MDNKILYTAKFTHHDLKFHKVWWKSNKRCGSLSGRTDRPEYLKLMVSDVNHEGYTPLLEACKQYAIYKVKLMVSDVNHEGYTPLLEACKQYAIYYTPRKHSLGGI